MAATAAIAWTARGEKARQALPAREATATNSTRVLVVLRRKWGPSRKGAPRDLPRFRKMLAPPGKLFPERARALSTARGGRGKQPLRLLNGPGARGEPAA